MNSTISATSEVIAPSAISSAVASLRLRRSANSALNAPRSAVIARPSIPARFSPTAFIPRSVWVRSAIQKGGISRLVRLIPRIIASRPILTY